MAREIKRKKLEVDGFVFQVTQVEIWQMWTIFNRKGNKNMIYLKNKKKHRQNNCKTSEWVSRMCVKLCELEGFQHEKKKKIERNCFLKAYDERRSLSFFSAQHRHSAVYIEHLLILLSWPSNILGNEWKKTEINCIFIFFCQLPQCSTWIVKQIVWFYSV